MANRRIVVDIIANTSGYVSGMRTVGTETATLGSRFSALGKTAAVAAGGAGITALTIAARAGVTEWLAHQKVAAQTNAVLKSTGGVAGITAGHVSDLATEVMNYSGIDDEAVQSTENLVLGFKKIRNEAGKGNDIFDRTVKLVEDYSVRTGKDARGAALLFGKALQEIAQGQIPASIRGVGKLSDETRKEIAAHLKAGDVVGAQSILLKQLESRYQGAAAAAGKTMPGQLDILKEKFRNLAGQGVEVLAKELQNLGPLFGTIGDIVRKLVPIITPIARYLFDNIVVPFKVIADLIRGDWSAAWKDLQKPVQDAIDAITGIVSPIADAIGGFFSDAVDAVTGAVSDALDAARQFGTSLLSGMENGIVGFAEWVSGRVTAAIQAVTGALGTALSTATAFGRNILTGMKNGIVGFAEWISSRVQAGLSAIRNAAGQALSAAGAFGRNILSGMRTGITGFGEAVSGRVHQGIQAIAGAAGSAYSAARSFGGRILSGIVDGLKALASRIVQLVAAPINKLIGGINAIQIHVPGLHFDTHIPGVGTVGFDGFDVDPIPGDIPKLATGGTVLETGLAVVHRGETFSGVGNRLGGGGTSETHIHFHGGTFIGGNADDVAKAIVRPMVREIQKYARANSLPGLLGT